MIGMRRWLGFGILGAWLGLGLPVAGHAAESFSSWLEGVRREALARGIAARTLDAAFADVAPIPSVIEADRRQPEGRFTFAQYRQRVVNAQRIAKGREMLARHRDLLRRVEARYGVPAEVMVALWGIESNFGERQGNYSVIASLATLAHEGRRASFFRKELLNALEIIDRGNIDAAAMRGSWAGAMGQNQFMPSTYLNYAIDFDGDGRRDIWRSLPDVFGSMANYLASSGWDARYIWGREVDVPRRAGTAQAGLDHRASLAAWQKLGVRLPGGGDLPRAQVEASLLRMDDGAGDSYLVYDNFRALMAWNRSTYFGVSVGLLANSLKSG